MKRRVHISVTAALWMMIIHFSPLANAQRDRLWPVYASNATVPTNLSTIRTFPEPPGNFDVVAATDDELAMYGFPPRPDKQTEPDHYKMWERAMLAAKIRWNGDLKVVSSQGPRTVGTLAEVDSRSGGTAQPLPTTPTSLNWSGVVLTKGVTRFNSNSFTDIYSMVTVPNGHAAWAGSCDQYRQLAWVGLNGYAKFYAIQPGNHKSALLGGVWSQAICGGSDASYTAIFGWEPSSIQGAFQVNPGDIVYMEVGAPAGGVNPSYLFIEDLTTLTYNSYSVPVPYGVTYVGDSAEWIVERWCCRNSGYPYPLLNTTSVNFDGGAALDGAGHTFYPGSQATTTQVITMRNDANDQNIELVNQGSGGFEGQHALLLQTTGCAWAGGCVDK